MSKFNEEMKIPYVSKKLCEYLRNTYSLPNVLYQVAGKVEGTEDSAFALGMMMGINTAIERLEAIAAQQEENDGIH